MCNAKKREDLEVVDLHLIIIDIKRKHNVLVIGLSRSFKPTDGSTPMEFFKKQIVTIKRYLTSRTLILGDFNLDLVMQYRQDCLHKHVYEILNDFTSQNVFVQLVDFPTWSQTIKNIYEKALNSQEVLNKVFTEISVS